MVNSKVLGNASTVVIVVGVFALLLAMLYLASSTGNNNTIVTSTQLQNAILIAKGLNETKEFRNTWKGVAGAGVTALYPDVNSTEMFRQQDGHAFLPKDKHTIHGSIWSQDIARKLAFLPVFIDPKTSQVYGTYQHATMFG